MATFNFKNTSCFENSKSVRLYTNETKTPYLPNFHEGWYHSPFQTILVYGPFIKPPKILFKKYNAYESN